jgi:ABC-type nitrate/sulfonate/bicarbonate transport system substrate-binding protein
MSLQAQKAGFSKLASSADYANLIEGGFAASNEKIKQNPEKIFRFIRASLKGIRFFANKREPTIKLMMDNMKISDHELVNAIYDINSKLILRDGYSDDKTLEAMIDTMKRTTKVTRDIKVVDVFDLAFVKRANDELKAAGWKP